MKKTTIAIMAAADDGYATPMTVALHSALVHLSKSVRAEIFIANNGISKAKQRICDKALTSAHPDFGIHWCNPDLSEFASINTGHLTATTFSRIFVNEIVRTDIDRVLYIDCDVVVGDDIAKLWKLDINGVAFMAALDGPGNSFDALIRSNFPEVSAPPNAPYFNAGVMLINLPEWRAQTMALKARDFIIKHGNALTHLDQCALNAVSVGLWKPLDLWWNTQVHDNLGRNLSGFGILHYTIFKPWVYSANTAKAHHYFRAYRRAGLDFAIVGWIKTATLGGTQAYLRWAKRVRHRTKRRVTRWVARIP